MADKNVGGIRASLSIDAQAWLKGLDDATRGLRAWERSVGKTFDNFNKSLVSSMQTAQRHLTAFGASVGVGIGAAITVFGEFDKAAREVNSIMRLSEKEAAKYRNSIRELTRDLRINVSQAEAMRGAYAVASAGFTDAAEQSKVLGAGLLLAKAGVADTASTLTALTGALRAYGAGADEAADYADVLFKTVELGQTTLPELAQSLSRATLTASTAGIGFDELGAAIAALTLKGVPTSTALDSINQAIIQMAAPSAQAEKALQSLGMTSKTLGKIMREQGLQAAIVKLFDAARGDVAQLKTILGDVNAVKGILALGKGGGAEFGGVRTAMADRGGAAAKGAAEISKSLTEQLGLMGNQLRDLAISVAEGLSPAIEDVNGLLKTLLERLQAIPEPVKQITAQIVAAAGGLALLGAGFTRIVPYLLNLVKLIGAGGLAAAFPAFTAALKVAGGALAVIAPVAMKVVAALALIGGAIAVNLGGLQDAVVAISKVVVDSVVYMADMFMTALRELGVVLGLTTGEVGSGLNTLAGLLLALANEIARYVMPLLVGTIAGLALAFTATFTAIVGAIRTFTPIIVGLFKALFEAVKFVWQGLTDLLQYGWRGAMERSAKRILESTPIIIAALKEAFGRAYDAVVDTIARFEVLGAKIGQAISNGIRRGRAGSDRLSEAAIKGGAVEGVTAGLATGKAQDLMARLAEMFGQVGTAATAAGKPAKPGKPPKPEPDTDETPGTPKAPTPSVASGKMTRAEMQAYVRQHADVTGNIEGLTEEAMVATFKLVENAMKSGIRLGITSGKRFGSGRSLHDIGQALDITIPGEGLGSTRAGAIAAQLAQGTGFRSGINEYLPEALRATGGTGPHVHMAMREDGRGVPGFFKIAGSTATALEQVRENLDAFAQDLMRAGMRLLSPEQQKRAEITERYAGLRQRGIEAGASPEMLARVAQLQRQELAELAKEEQDAAIEFIQRTAAEDQRATEQRRQARMADVQEQRREKFAQMDFDRRLNRATLDDQIRLYEEELGSRNLNKEQRRTMQLELYELHQQDIEARLTDQADYNERWLKAELERLALADQANESVQLRQIALNDQLRRLEAQRTDDSVRSLTFVEQQFAGFFSSVLSGQQNLGSAFKQLWTSIKNHVIQQISEMIVKSKAFEGLFGWLSGPTGIIAKLFGAHGGGTAGAPGSMETIPSFHTGGLVSRGSMRASTGMQLRSDEILAKLQTGEVVLSRDQVAAMKQSQDRGTGVNVYVSPSMVQAVDPDRLGRIIGRDIMWRMQGA